MKREKPIAYFTDPKGQDVFEQIDPSPIIGTDDGMGEVMFNQIRIFNSNGETRVAFFNSGILVFHKTAPETNLQDGDSLFINGITGIG